MIALLYIGRKDEETKLCHSVIQSESAASSFNEMCINFETCQPFKSRLTKMWSNLTSHDSGSDTRAAIKQ